MELSWPIEDGRAGTGMINQWFGANPQNYQKYGLPGHDGLDFACGFGVEVINPFLAGPEGARVVESTAQKAQGYHHVYGLHVRLEARIGGAYHTIYGHLSDNLNVTVGQDVPGGYKLGYSGNTGNIDGYHLHFGMKRFPTGQVGWPYNIIDPTPYLNLL